MEENKFKYNPWPLGEINKELQRPEFDLLKSLNYRWKDPRDIVEIFEEKLAFFSGSKYAIATDSCTHAMELCFRYLLYKEELVTNHSIKLPSEIIIPNRTYISAYIMLKQLGFYIGLENIKWDGVYHFKGSRVIDGAVRWKRGMYLENSGIEDNFIYNSLHCLSFQIKKRIPIGRGGAILCNSKEEYEWFKLAVYDGRDLITKYDDVNHLKMLGWHYYMTPEDAARGIILMNFIIKEGDTGNYTMYPEISKMISRL